MEFVTNVTNYTCVKYLWARVKFFRIKEKNLIVDNFTKADDF